MLLYRFLGLMTITVDTVICKSITLSFSTGRVDASLRGRFLCHWCDIQLALALSQISRWFRGRITQAETEDNFTYIT